MEQFNSINIRFAYRTRKNVASIKDHSILKSLIKVYLIEVSRYYLNLIVLYKSEMSRCRDKS